MSGSCPRQPRRCRCLTTPLLTEQNAFMAARIPRLLILVALVAASTGCAAPAASLTSTVVSPSTTSAVVSPPTQSPPPQVVTAASASASAPSTSPSPSTTPRATSATSASDLAVRRNADGTCSMPPALAGHDFTALPKSTGKVIALTFDGGASNAADARIMQVLADKDATATFFFTGKFAEMYPATVKAIAAKYPIGNHSYDHPSFTKIGDAKVLNEIDKGEAAILKASGGVSPVPLFRFPFGDRNAHDTQLVNARCYVPFRWTIDTLGWAGKKNNSVAKILALVTKSATPGGIILMHQGDNPDDHSTLDADALPAMIDGLRAQGYQFVTLADALKA